MVTITNSMILYILACLLFLIVRSIHLPQIQPHSSYLYSNQSGNLVWAGAMNLAWNSLKQQIVKEPVKLITSQTNTLKSLQALNNPPITNDDMHPNDYYVKSGFGQETVDTINTEMKQKFPDNSFGPLDVRLSPFDVISYAYFMKKIKYLNKFEKKQDFKFNGKIVKGFAAQSKLSMQNINLHEYKNNDDFMISLKLVQDDTQIFMYKSGKKQSFQEVVDKIENIRGNGTSLQNKDQFGAPEVHFDFRREYGQMIGKRIGNKMLYNYTIGKMFERVKLDMDNEGVKVQNQALILGEAGSAPVAEMRIPKLLIFDKPYWIVMKMRDKKPFLIVQVNSIK